MRDLVLALAVLEQEGIVHGDLSPNNIVIDLAAQPDQPALYLIDFDAFVAPAAGANEAVTVAEGGTYGTEGYCPPDLAAAASRGRWFRGALFGPLWARHAAGGTAHHGQRPVAGRSAVELGMATSFSAATRPGRPAAIPACLQTLSHLDPATLFTLAEQDRPASTELAAGLGLVAAADATAAAHDAALESHAGGAWSALGLRGRPAGEPAPATRSSSTPATLNFIVPWRWSRPEADPSYTTLWQDIRLALLLASPFILLLIIGLLTAIFGK